MACFVNFGISCLSSLQAVLRIRPRIQPDPIFFKLLYPDSYFFAEFNSFVLYTCNYVQLLKRCICNSRIRNRIFLKVPDPNFLGFGAVFFFKGWIRNTLPGIRLMSWRKYTVVVRLSYCAFLCRVYKNVRQCCQRYPLAL